MERHAEVIPLDGRRGAEAHAVVAVGVLDDTLEHGVERDAFGDAPDREIAIHVPLGGVDRVDRRAGEGPGRMVLDIEEVVRPQVVVAVLVMGVHACGLNGYRHRGVGRVLGDVQRTFEVCEPATDLGHGHVPHGESEPSVAHVDGVGADGRIFGSVNGSAGSGICHVCSLELPPRSHQGN